MPADVDVVRCAAPWPEPAARLLEAFATLGIGSWTPERSRWLMTGLPMSAQPTCSDSGNGASLEAGVLVGGPAAYYVAALIAAVLRVARQL
jgi:hypothetical protein